MTNEIKNTDIETKTFTSKEGFLTLTVKKEFLIDCPDPEKVDSFTLFKDKRITDFFHSTSGPAIVVRDIKHNNALLHQEYWIEGKRISKAEGEKLIHDSKFHKEMDTVLQSGE